MFLCKINTMAHGMVNAIIKLVFKKEADQSMRKALAA